MTILDDILGLGQPGASDPLTGIAMILGDVFGGEPSPQPGPGAGRATPPSLLPAMLGGPEMRTTNVGEVGPMPRMAPQLMPQQAVPQSRPAPAPSLPDNEPSLMDRFTAFARGSDKGGLLGGLSEAFDGVDKQKQMATGTFGALVNRGIDPAMAKLIVSDPDTMRKIIPSIFSEQFNPAAPNIINLKSRDQFGEGTETPYYWNPKTRKLEPATSLVAGGGAPASQPVVNPAPDPVPAQRSAPSLVPQQFMLPGDLQTQNMGEIGASGMPNAAAGPILPDPQPLGTQSAAAAGDKAPPSLWTPGMQNGAPQAAQGSQRYIVGPAAPEARLGPGYMQKTDEQGRPLWQQVQGKLQPVVEPKAAAEARGRTQEQLAVKKGEAQQVAEENVGGLKAIVKNARALTDAPGFDDALKLNAWSFNVGVNAGQFGNVGGDVLTPVKQIAKMFDRQNPAWSTNDAIGQVQNELSLTAGRAFLKGQGQVSNFERQMVADAIGNIAGATSKADYQFRLNAAEKMIEDVNAGIKIKSSNEYNIRPTNAEIQSVITKDNRISEDKLMDLSKRYNVHPADMQNYVNELYKRGH